MAKFVITEENNKAHCVAVASMQSLAIVCRMDHAMLRFITAIIHTYDIRIAYIFIIFLSLSAGSASTLDRALEQRIIIIYFASERDEARRFDVPWENNFALCPFATKHIFIVIKMA